MENLYCVFPYIQDSVQLLTCFFVKSLNKPYYGRTEALIKPRVVFTVSSFVGIILYLRLAVIISFLRRKSLNNPFKDHNKSRRLNLKFESSKLVEF